MREVAISSLFPASTVARKAFYALGRKLVYTNSYKNCNTVKAYSTRSSVRDAEIVYSVVKLLSDSGYEQITANVTDRAIIIRIPK
jgi:hypothetical protein